jgi:hypothetical protein
MNCWDSVLSSSNNRERGEIWVKTQPSTSVKLIENVIWLTVSVGKSWAQHKHSQMLRDALGCHGQGLESFDLLILRRRRSLLNILVCEEFFFVLRFFLASLRPWTWLCLNLLWTWWRFLWCIDPCHHRGYKDNSLIFNDSTWWTVMILDDFNDFLNFIETAT